MKGLSIYICFGKYGGFRIIRDAGIRITLGWIGMAIVLYDLERMVHMLAHSLDDCTERLVNAMQKDI